MATQDPLIKAGNEAAQNLPADLQANASIPAGQPGSPWVLPNPSVAVTTPQTIPAEQVANASPLPLVQQPVNPPAEPTPAQGTTKTIDQYIQDMTPATPGKYGTEANSLLDSLSTLMPELKNKGADTITAENQAGLPQMNTELRGLQNEIQNDYIELQRSQKNIMASGLDRSVATAQQRQDYENRSFDYNLKVAKANYLTGNIEAAQKQVDRAIAQKYDPIQQEYDLKTKQLQLIAPFLTAEENKIAKAAELKIADDKQKLEEKKADEKTNLNIALQAGAKTPAVNTNGKFFNARTGETYATPADFFKAMGVKSFEEAYQKGLVTDVNVADLNLVAQAQAKYPDVKIPYNATQDQIAQIIKGSRIYQKDTYIAPTSTPDYNFDTSSILASDPDSQSILAQTGLSMNAFMYLTGKASQLPRDQATRNAAAIEAAKWANARGVDVSTLASQYATYNAVLSKNIDRYNSTQIMESEILGTVDNLKDVVNNKELGKLKWGNVVKLWAGDQVNDKLASQYAMHLNQLRTELAGYNAAAQGRTGNNVTEQDYHEAELVIKNGISNGSLDGLRAAVESSTGKMGTVMNGSINNSRKQIWDLFGVGGKYQSNGSTDANKIIEYNGKRYSVDAQGNMTEIK